MKKSGQKTKLFYEKAAVTELNNNELQNIAGGTNTLVYQQAITLMTSQIVTATLICDEVDAN